MLRTVLHEPRVPYLLPAQVEHQPEMKDHIIRHIIHQSRAQGNKILLALSVVFVFLSVPSIQHAELKIKAP